MHLRELTFWNNSSCAQSDPVGFPVCLSSFCDIESQLWVQVYSCCQALDILISFGRSPDFLAAILFCRLHSESCSRYSTLVVCRPWRSAFEYGSYDPAITWPIWYCIHSESLVSSPNAMLTLTWNDPPTPAADPWHHQAASSSLLRTGRSSVSSPTAAPGVARSYKQSNHSILWSGYLCSSSLLTASSLSFFDSSIALIYCWISKFWRRLMSYHGVIHAKHFLLMLLENWILKFWGFLLDGWVLLKRSIHTFIETQFD